MSFVYRSDGRGLVQVSLFELINAARQHGVLALTACNAIAIIVRFKRREVLQPVDANAAAGLSERIDSRRRAWRRRLTP